MRTLHDRDAVITGAAEALAASSPSSSPAAERRSPRSISAQKTTYLTGTLTTVVIRLTSGKRLADVSHSLWILFGLVVGAAAGALLVRHAPVVVPLIQLSTVLTVLAVAVVRFRPSVVCRSH